MSSGAQENSIDVLENIFWQRRHRRSNAEQLLDKTQFGSSLEVRQVLLIMSQVATIRWATSILFSIREKVQQSIIEHGGCL